MGKIAKSVEIKNTFGKSRSPSPWRTSRSVSPSNSRSNSKKRNKKKRNRDRSNSKNRNRDRSNSRRRNSFGTSIPNAPPRAQKNIKRLPVYPSSSDTSRIDLSESENDNAENDMNILNTMDKRKERIFAKLEDRKNRLFGNRVNNKTVDAQQEEETEQDDDDESSFNPTQEIESIDSRLNALQKFLRAAKSSA